MKNKRDIDSIVFDLGGVVIDLDRDRAVRALELLGMSSAGEYLDLYCQSGPFLDLETGRLTAGEFYDRVRPECFPGVSDEQIQDAFNAFLVGIPIERLQSLRKLREMGYRLLALSNTNPIMYDSWIKREFMVEGFRINDYFDGVVASFQEGCCKPDARIFETLIRRYGLDPARTLYLDDGAANCEAAAKAGLQTWHVTAERPMTMLDESLKP